MNTIRSSRRPVMVLGMALSLAAIAVDAPPATSQPPSPPLPNQAQQTLTERFLPEPHEAFTPTVMTPELTTMAKARFEAARAQYEEIWAFYRQKRIDQTTVYIWSRLLLESRRDLCRTQEEWITALEEHRDHILELKALVSRVSRLGFIRQVDVKGVIYFQAEADYWIARARQR